MMLFMLRSTSKSSRRKRKNENEKKNLQMAALTKRQAPGWRRKQNDLTQTSELRTAPTQTTLLITRMAKLGGRHRTNSNLLCLR